MKTIFEKEYALPDVKLFMYYMKDGSGRVVYPREYRQMPEEEFKKCKSIVGIYCLKCGEYHETQDEIGDIRDVECKCGKLRRLDETNSICTNGNPKALYARLADAFPLKLKITEKGEKIRIAATFQGWFINAKAKKPYSKTFTTTLVMNTETGQSYCMPGVSKGKVVCGYPHITNVSFEARTPIVDRIQGAFFDADKEAEKALAEVFAQHCPGYKVTELREMFHANFMRDLYGYLPESYDFTSMVLWKRLRKRYRQDSETFCRYLYRGCTKVATKSIKRILYKHPEKKWMLKVLYQKLGITDPNILKRCLEKPDADDISAYVYFHVWESDRRAEDRLFEACRSMSDLKKEAFFLKEDDWFTVRDAARMYAALEDKSVDPCDYGSVREFHDALIEKRFCEQNRKMWENYNKEISYSERINSLEGDFEGAEFRLMRKPWDLKELGKLYHNCVGTYMSSMFANRSVILSMLIDKKPSACIELDGTGRYCFQAYAACNKPLSEEAERVFELWKEANKIESPSSYVYEDMALPF